jgi:hypothetical protein
MNPNKKSLLIFTSLVLIFVTIACSFGSPTPFSSSTTPTPSVSSSTPGVSVPSATAPVVQSGSPYVEQVTAQINILTGETGTATATCPENGLMVGGGFASGKGLKVTKTMPDSGNWVVVGQNNSTATLSLAVYAVCLHNVPGTIKIVSAQVPASGAPFVWCQNNEIATGGGYAFDSNSLEVYINTPVGETNSAQQGWSVMARNNQSADQPVSVYVVCLLGSSLKRTLIRDQVTFGPDSNSLNFTLACPNGSFMIAGGYEGTGVYINRIDPTDISLWDVQVQGKYFFDGSLDHAVCLSLP